MNLRKPSLRIRIYFSMLALILFSLLIIGITTIVFFNNQNEKYHIERLKRKEHTVATSLQYFLKEVKIDEHMDIVRRDFEYKVKEIADVNDIEINIFNTKGEILMSSRDDKDDPDFYTQKINDTILENLVKTKERQVEEFEKNYVSTYTYILNNEGKEVAIINIPYQLIDSINDEDLTSFLTTLVEIYLFLLIGASLLAYFLSNYITKSLRVIAESFKLIKINKKNAEIEWKGDDEIGTLIAEYNKMIEELEESATKLFKSERESAWREMAKQVAHEIKNPLTPMKLSVQHLQRSLDKNDPDFEEKVAKFSEKMIQQIEALTTIANEFSNFAKMPKANLEPIEIQDLLKSTIDLYGETDNVEIVYSDNGIEEGKIIGDKEQLIRVFNNLIKNAIQAIPDDKKGMINVEMVKKGNSFLIQIKDNGIGIPKDLEEKIFSPNFTTKSTGSGLGLAMVKQIIETHRGDIYFVTKEGEGTTFFVEIPCA